MILFRVTAAGLAAGNAGKSIPCGRAALPAFAITIMMIMMVVAVMVVTVMVMTVTAVMVAGNLRTSYRPAFLGTGAVIFTVSAPLTAHIAAIHISAATSTTAAASQQQQDNQTVHTPYFLSVLLLYPMPQIC